MRDGHDEDEKHSEARRRFREYECPECQANNPMDDGLYEGDEVHCFYCGVGFKAAVADGRLKMKPL